MHGARGNFGDEVESRVRTDGDNRGHPEAENQHRQQQHAPAQTGHADQKTYNQPDQDFEGD
jgi:hypothetical protein